MPQLILSVEGVQIKHLYLHQNRTTLGRKPHNDIVLDNPVVSGEHCVFELHGMLDVYVEDLRSTNGTYINGKMIAHQRLADHDLIAIGKFRIQFLSSSEPPDFGVTSSMKLDGLSPSAAISQRHASFQMLSGSSAGLEVPVVKAVTTFGKPGVAVVAVSHRRNGYYVAHMEGSILPKLNGDPIGQGAVPLADHDVLELAGTRMLFLLKE